jgi:hypothetical protein
MGRLIGRASQERRAMNEYRWIMRDSDGGSERNPVKSFLVHSLGP